MHNKVSKVLFFLLLPVTVAAQSLNLSVTPSTANNNSSTFLLEEGKVSISSQSVRFLSGSRSISDLNAVGISADQSRVGILQPASKDGKITIYDSQGQALNSFSVSSFTADDPSNALYPFYNGYVLMRYNITNFKLFDTFGDVVAYGSNSSGSKQGETITEVAASPAGETIVVYTTKIKRRGKLGSRAQRVTAGGKMDEIYNSYDHYLKKMSVSADGNLVLAITASEGTSDELVVMDKYGNEINSFSTDESLQGATLSMDGEHVTLYSAGRVMVYNLLTGERLGASSFRAPVFLAEYFAEDHTILVLTGSYSESAGVLANIEFRAINLERREITSKEFSARLGVAQSIEPYFERVGSGQYLLMGTSKRVKVNTDF